MSTSTIRLARYLILAAFAGSALLLGGRGPGAPLQSAAAETASTPAFAKTLAAASRPGATSVPELLQAAVAAYRQGRIVAPAADSAVHYYLAVLQQDPRNPVARDALRDSFPYAVAQVERTIDGGDAEEAGREIALLTAADPDNYTHTLLRDRLEARSGAATHRTPAANGKALAPAAHSLTLKASGNSWINLTDARGRTLDSRILRTGESRTYQLIGAVKLTLGNASDVAVTHEGKAIPTATGHRDKVMHLELFARS